MATIYESFKTGLSYLIDNSMLLQTIKTRYTIDIMPDATPLPIVVVRVSTNGLDNNIFEFNTDYSLSTATVTSQQGYCEITMVATNPGESVVISIDDVVINIPESTSIADAYALMQAAFATLPVDSNIELITSTLYGEGNDIALITVYYKLTAGGVTPDYNVVNTGAIYSVNYNFPLNFVPYTDVSVPFDPLDIPAYARTVYDQLLQAFGNYTLKGVIPLVYPPTS